MSIQLKSKWGVNNISFRLFFNVTINITLLLVVYNRSHMYVVIEMPNEWQDLPYTNNCLWVKVNGHGFTFWPVYPLFKLKVLWRSIFLFLKVILCARKNTCKKKRRNKKKQTKYILQFQMVWEMLSWNPDRKLNSWEIIRKNKQCVIVWMMSDYCGCQWRTRVQMRGKGAQLI